MGFLGQSVTLYEQGIADNIPKGEARMPEVISASLEMPTSAVGSEGLGLTI